MCARLQVLRILNNVTWKEAGVLRHPEKVTSGDVTVFEEVTDTLTSEDGNVPAEELDSDEEDARAACDGQENAGQAMRQRRYAVCDHPAQVSCRAMCTVLHS